MVLKQCVRDDACLWKSHSQKKIVYWSAYHAELAWWTKNRVGHLEVPKQYVTAQ